MMNINVTKLNAQKSWSGQMEFTYDAPEELIGVPFAKFVAPVKVEIEYDILEDDSVEIRGRVIYDLVGQCSRCLSDAKAHVEGEIDAYFQPFQDAEDYSYKNGTIVLDDAVNDAIMASMPYVLSCGKDCPELRY